MAKASDKRIASTNEAALKNFQLGLLGVNGSSLLIRYLYHLIGSKALYGSKKLFVLHTVTFASTIAVARWFTLIGKPKNIGGNVRAGDDLAAGGFIELAWDLVYMTWICTLGSAILGNWIWWFYLLVPGFGVYKLVMTFRPILAMLLPSIFGTGQPRAVAVPAGGQADAGAPEGESKRQAKLRARMEKGDKRVQSTQTTRQR